MTRRDKIRALRRTLEPCEEEARAWLTAVKQQRVTFDELSNICGVSDDTVWQWCMGSHQIPPMARRGLWLAWSMLYRPENLRDLFTVATWGRFTQAAKRDKMWHRGRYRGKEPPKVGVKRKNAKPTLAQVQDYNL